MAIKTYGYFECDFECDDLENSKNICEVQNNGSKIEVFEYKGSFFWSLGSEKIRKCDTVEELITDISKSLVDALGEQSMLICNIEKALYGRM